MGTLDTTTTNTNTAGNITTTKAMRSVISAAREVLQVFPYGPHFRPEQNRALASLRAAMDNRKRKRELDLDTLRAVRKAIKEVREYYRKKNKVRA